MGVAELPDGQKVHALHHWPRSERVAQVAEVKAINRSTPNRREEEPIHEVVAVKPEASAIRTAQAYQQFPQPHEFRFR